MLDCQLSVQEMESRRRQGIYGKICRIAPRTGKETAHGTSLENAAHQKEEWVGKKSNYCSAGDFFIVIFDITPLKT